MVGGSVVKNFQKWKKQCLSNKIFDVVNLLILLFVFFVCLYPLYYIVIASFSETVVGVYFLPKGFNFYGYELIFSDPDIWIGYGNTIFYTVAGVLASLAVTLPFAYALSRKDFVGRNLMTGFIMVTMFIKENRAGL